MFDMSKLGDMAKIANQARQVQATQERMQREQIDLLKQISSRLDNIANILKEPRQGN